MDTAATHAGTGSAAAGSRVGPAAFAALWLWVGVSSAWDLSLAVAAGPHLDELNPAGLALLESGGPAALVMAKTTGTVVVLGVLVILRAWWRRAAWAALAALAAFQAGLVAFLYGA